MYKLKIFVYLSFSDSNLINAIHTLEFRYSYQCLYMKLFNSINYNKFIILMHKMP